MNERRAVLSVRVICRVAGRRGNVRTSKRSEKVYLGSGQHLRERDSKKKKEKLHSESGLRKGKN